MENPKHKQSAPQNSQLPEKKEIHEQKTENQVKDKNINQPIIPIENNRCIFGIYLDELMKQEKGKSHGIPSFIQEIISQIILRGLNKENLFVNSNQVSDKVELLASKIDTKQKYDVTNESPIVLSLVMKKFFKNLPEPLIPIQMYQTFLGGF